MTTTSHNAPWDFTLPKLPEGLKSALLPAAIGAVVGAAIWFKASGLAQDAKIVLIVTVFAVVGWVATRLPDSLVALTAALALVVTGAQPQEALTNTLGEKIVWLLLAAFVIAAVVKEAGLAERLVAPLTRGAPRVLPFFVVTGAAISATAFLLPSTSGRAALLLPVFLGLVGSLPDPRLIKPLALLFPTAILLSAGGSLIGAGAHVVAVEAIGATGGPQVGYLEWLKIGTPLAAGSVFLATILIFVIFVPPSLWLAHITPSENRGRYSTIQRRILIVLIALVGLWIAKPLHGLDEAIVAIGGAVLLLFPPFCERKPKEVFRSVDVELVLYMAATLMLSVAVIDTGADRWLAAAALKLLPAAVVTNTGAAVVFLSIVAVASHLAITSRSARAAILIPALALPVAGFGHDTTLAILIAVLGTGFCQTMMVSAKPVAIFGLREDAGFTQKDLFKLALPLAPIKIGLICVFALWVWPNQLETLSTKNSATSSATTETQSQTMEERAAIAGQQDQRPALPLAASLRPQARPKQTANAPARPILIPPRREASAPTRSEPPLIAQVRKDLRQAGTDIRTAGKQIERGLSRLFR
ncbi:SLC13 family permease [Ruegeria sp. HKCCD8929]|uniref:SLC13 family permease n=1 Tax=Ruegeria sp. HKCCD8929 TaxID=2683006 RepID=UPI00148779E7|nr:SLC13 family permease [Ruegeria sp. HKCCD8929]